MLTRKKLERAFGRLDVRIERVRGMHRIVYTKDWIRHKREVHVLKINDLTIEEWLAEAKLLVEAVDAGANMEVISRTRMDRPVAKLRWQQLARYQQRMKK